MKAIFRERLVDFNWEWNEKKRTFQKLERGAKGKSQEGGCSTRNRMFAL